jgi:hypothetical protein
MWPKLRGKEMRWYLLLIGRFHIIAHAKWASIFNGRTMDGLEVVINFDTDCFCTRFV